MESHHEVILRTVYLFEGDDRFLVRPNREGMNGGTDYLVARIEIYSDFVRLLGTYHGHGGELRDLGSYGDYELSLQVSRGLMQRIRILQQALQRPVSQQDIDAVAAAHAFSGN